ncbi:MAG: DUF4139 domain-containing protein [Treponema sp.]|nr:DUF4139 domain-containing protein [Treponema sp.]MCL2251962.1 DUF4139 domain-containing protein [Treponema sp.]
MKNKFLIIFCIFIFAVTNGVCNLWAQGIQDTSQQTAAQQAVAANASDLPLKKVVILTSGLAYYEHSGSVNGSVNINLPFKLNAVNDALKTLIINDPSSANPSVTYQSENTLIQTLRSLSIDLSDYPDFATFLLRLRGVEVEITTSSVFKGRILGIDYRRVSDNAFSGTSIETYLLLNSNNGMMNLNLNEISSIKFTDNAINNDLNRALDLIASSRNHFSRRLSINLNGSGRRNVSVSYVIPSPVWKVSYRLDLSSQKPLFQGWAIIDNDSDTDWNNVELSLVAGRPASFIQELYPPYYVSRPVMPLSIAGTAEGIAHERSVPQPVYGMSAQSNTAKVELESATMADSAYMARERTVMTGGAVQTAAGSSAGGQFEFTIKNPVSLNRQMSAMFPLVEASIEGEKFLLYSGSGRHPRLGAEIKNTSGMKLPAGPITVYDGVYAGDALIEFWNENEKRLISFGEDLSVTSAVSDTNTRAVSSVRITAGVMSINRNITFVKTYTFLNTDTSAKKLLIEHTKTTQTELVSPNAIETTASAYRFITNLPSNRETTFQVSEQRPISETITLLPLRTESLISYTSNQEIPSNVRAALQRAVELKRAVDAADIEVKEIDSQRERLIADQDRIRRNLEAAGNQTQQGQEYLRRLVALDSEIDSARTGLNDANNKARAARTAYENYLNTLNI